MSASRRVSATFGLGTVVADPPFERAYADALRANFTVEERMATFDRFRSGSGAFDALHRRLLLRSLVTSMGDGVRIDPDLRFLHPHSFEIGEGTFFGTGVFIQGRHDGRCVIGRRCWIGPGAYLDARDLVLGDWVGWGPGAKILGSEHTGEPISAPIIRTDLVIASVRVGTGADIGTNAIVMPGVTIGEGAIVGAGAVVTADVEPYTIVAGVPARLLRRRGPATPADYP